jgi:hypothetical protein
LAVERKAMIMPCVRFTVGDRVTLRYPQQLPAGTVGTVVRVYTAVQEGYDVAFGDHPLALLWGSELDRVVDAPPPDRPDTPTLVEARYSGAHTSAAPAEIGQGCGFGLHPNSARIDS